MELSIVETAETHTHVALKGSLDIKGTGMVEVRFAAATAGRGKPTLVDLSALDFICSLGMGMLLSCARALTSKGAPMVLFDPQRAIEKALRAAGLDRAFAIVQGIDSARALLQPAPSKSDSASGPSRNDGV